MHHRRRPTAIVAPVAGVLLAVSLSACGFHYPTDRVNTISAGVNDRPAGSQIAALGIRILASAPGEGRLIGALANNDRDNEAQLIEVATADGSVTSKTFTPITLSANGKYNLSTKVNDPVFVTGPFGPGQVVRNLQLTFQQDGKKQVFDMNVPVVKPCHQYTQVPTPTEDPFSQAASAKTGAAAETSAPADESTDLPTPAGDATLGGTHAFLCVNPTPGVGDAE